jgi:hypothetical protein
VTLSRRSVLAVATGSLLLGGLALPAVAAPTDVAPALTGGDSEHVCLYTRNNQQTGERDGFCVWIPRVLPPTPLSR